MFFNFRTWFLPKIISNMDFSDLKPIDLDKIETVDFPADQYFSEEYEKKQIVLHHTVSGPDVRGDINTWIRDTRRIATCIIIDGTGVPHQLFSSKYWAGHLGTGKSILDKESIGVEIDNWGWLKPTDNPKKWETFYGNKVEVEVQEYPNLFRDYRYYEKYKEAQLKTLGELLLFWNQRYGIPLTYNEDMWEVSQRALEGMPGVWSHTSYRPKPDKTDCHPQPELIELLKTLPTLI